MNDAKESYMGHLSCKGRTARTEKDLYRICPSNLSKRELEDLYFALLEQNVQLKKTINEQRDQIKLLNTRVQRMTVQKPAVGFHNRDCCAGAKAVINEQKETIADLKKANERLSERLRLLNMRLCSTKQFLKRGSCQTVSYCSKCLANASIKNSSMSALNTKRSDSKLRIDSLCQMEKDNLNVQLTAVDIPMQSAVVTSSQADIPVQDASCQRNECRSAIDDLKLKVSSLEEELCIVRRSHSERMRALEAAAAAHALCPERAARLSRELRGSRQRADELATQLQLQQARTSEMVARQHDEDVSGRLEQATATLSARTLPLRELPQEDPSTPVTSDWENCLPILVPNNSGISIFVEEKCHKNSDDSGFTDYKNKELEESKEMEREENIESRIENFQSQQDYLENAATKAEAPSAPLGAESSLSHDIFSTSRYKILPEFDKIPSISKEPEALVSTDFLNDEHTTEKTRKYGPEFKYNIPAPLSLDLPRMSLGDTGTDNKIVENEVTDKNGSDKSKGGNQIEGSDKVKQTKQGLVDGGERSIIDSLDKSTQIFQDIIEEGKTNNNFRKARRSSLKSPYESKQSRDVAVRYGQTQTYRNAETETNAINVSKGTDIDKVYVEPDEDHDSDPSVQYKVNERASIRRIRYVTDVRTDPYMEPRANGPGFDPVEGTNRGGNDVGMQCLKEMSCDAPCEERGASPYGSVREGAAPYGAGGRVAEETIALDMSNPALCAALTRVCVCPPGSGAGPVLLRTCSGAAAGPAPARCPRYRACACGPNPPPSEPPAPSSDRTDCELPSLSDLTGAHDKNLQGYLSPGEEKATSTLSESMVTTDGGSLSEGEVPAAGGKRLSSTSANMTEPAWSNRSDKMEDALRAISEELTRCRELLQRRRREDLKLVDESSPRSSVSPPGGHNGLSLRRAEGSCRMGDSYTPKCIFTLHVGTLVLADQAAAARRGRALQARWRLYRQAGAGTRALHGRVCNYDCTAHYDLALTDHLLHYLKHEEMPIVIAEMDKQDEEFATCALPLRDALLHPNRRVDMSLALVSAEPGGEEAGVLDVWCSLRVDANALPAINTAIVRPSSLKSPHNVSSMLDQILDDDQSVDYRFSKDLRRSKGASEDTQSYHRESLDKVPEMKRTNNEVIENEVSTNIQSVTDFKNAIAKKSNDSTSIYEMLKNKKWPRRSTLGSQKNQEGGRHKSVTISNQVPLSRTDRRDTTPTMELSQSNISSEENLHSLDITILWLALNEDCKAMSDPAVQRLYVAYSFLGKSGADLETPVSLPKPKHYMDKCHFLFKKTFLVSDCDMPALGRLAHCMPTAGAPDPKRAVVFSVVSEPSDDLLGLDSCVDIGHAYLYLGEVLARSAGASYTAMLEVKDARGLGCGVLAVRLDGLALLRRCKERVVVMVSTGGERLDGLALLRRCKERLVVLVSLLHSPSTIAPVVVTSPPRPPPHPSPSSPLRLRQNGFEPANSLTRSTASF